jgi:tetratricopeptide (TPR) repeat protein
MNNVLNQCIKQAKQLKQYLRVGDMSRFKEEMRDLWDLFDASQDINKESLTQIAEIICDLLFEKGIYHSDQMDFIKLSGCVNDARDLSEQFPHSKSITTDFLNLLTGLFTLKLQYREFEYLDEYIPEVLALSRRFEQDEAVSQAASICLASLQNLCPYGEVGVSMILPLLEQLEKLAALYPSNKQICFALLQSLLLFCCVMKHHQRQEVYREYIGKFSEALTSYNHIIPRDQLEFIETEIIKHGLDILF